MISIDTKGMKIDQKEMSAFIQQQMLELTPHLDDKSALQVRLTQTQDGYEVELTAHQEDGDIQTVGWHEDIYDAIKNAKEGLLLYFVESEDQENPHIRESKINIIKQHGNLYLH